MSDVDRCITQAFREARAFCRQVHLLLNAADGMMETEGWEIASQQNTCFADTSQSLSKPDMWLPQYFCRFYVHADMPELLTYIGVILDETPEPNRVTEALVSAGWLDYGPDGPKQWREYWFCKAHLWAKARVDDGRLCFCDLSEWQKSLKGRVRQLASFAYPLSSVTGLSELHELVVSRLREHIKANRQAGKGELQR